MAGASLSAYCDMVLASFESGKEKGLPHEHGRPSTGFFFASVRLLQSAHRFPSRWPVLRTGERTVSELGLYSGLRRQGGPPSSTTIIRRLSSF